MSRPLHLALELDGEGAHPAAWRRSSHAPAALLTPERVRALAHVAEDAGVTLATFDDSLLPPGGVGPVGRIGAVERAAIAAVHTSVLGLAPAVSTAHSEPFQVGAQFASLDYAATCRAAWLVVAADPFDTAAALRALDQPVEGQLVVLAPAGSLPAGLADVELVEGRPIGALAGEGRGLRFAELEIALDTPALSAAERLADLDRHAPWTAGPRLRYTGPPGGLVALLEELADVVDGVRLRPAVIDEDLPELSARVLPALLRSGTTARPQPGVSLRSTLGLPRPARRSARHLTAVEWTA